MGIIIKHACTPQEEIHRLAQEGWAAVNATSRGKDPLWRQLSPFFLHTKPWPPVLMENFWQFSKFYPCHGEVTYRHGRHREFPVPGFLGESVTLPEVNVTEAFLRQSREGFLMGHAARRPYGRQKPTCSVMKAGGKFYALDYIQARKLLYAPQYAAAVKGTDAWAALAGMYREGQRIMLLDFDVTDTRRPFRDALEDPSRICGHCTVLKGMLTGEYCP